MRSDIIPGGTFPDYELPDQTKNVPRKLSELQGEDPLILTLARGHYFPKEHQQHLELAAAYTESPWPTPRSSRSPPTTTTRYRFRASVGAQWPFLSERGRVVQKDLDIQEYTDPEHDPMIPHTLVLKPGLVVYSIYNGYWFWGRPWINNLSHDLRAVTARDPARLGLEHRRGYRRPGRPATTPSSTAGTGGRPGLPRTRTSDTAE